MTRILILLFGAIIALPLSAASSDALLNAEQGDAIIKELRAIRLLLEKQATPPAAAVKAIPPPAKTAEISIENRPAMGAEDAPLVLVEFSDYQCPFCRRFHLDSFPKLKQEYIDTGKLRYVAMDLPLGFHENAIGAANAAHCAGDQGKFWELRHLMIKNADKLDLVSIEGYAQEVGLNMGSFKLCLAEKPQQQKIEADMQTAGRIGISGTPSFVLASSIDKESVKGQIIVGAKPYASFVTLIEAELNKQTKNRDKKDMLSKNYRLNSTLQKLGSTQ